MATRFIDLPDDCVLVFLQWLTILEIVRLREVSLHMNIFDRNRLHSCRHANEWRISHVYARGGIQSTDAC